MSAFRAAGYAVAGTALTIQPADEADFVTVSGDIASPRLPTRSWPARLTGSAGSTPSSTTPGSSSASRSPSTRVEDYAAMVAVNLTGFFHITQRVIRQMRSQQAGHVVNVSTSLVDHARSASPAGARPR